MNIFFMLLFASSLYYALPVAETISFTPDYSGCLRSFDAGRQANGQRALRIYNGCPERLVINACVLDSDGKTTSYNSGRTVPANGSFNIFLFPGVSPQRVEFTAARTNPPIPALCQK